MKAALIALLTSVIALSGAGVTKATTPPDEDEITIEELDEIAASFVEVAEDEGHEGLERVACTVADGRATCYGTGPSRAIVRGSGSWSVRRMPAWTFANYVSARATLPTTTTAAPAATTTAAPAAAVGTRENPIPLGLPIPANPWTYTVTGFETSVDGLIMNINEFNEPAPPDHQYVRVRIRASYDGSGVGNPLFVTINLVDGSGTTYAPVSPCCPPEIGQLTDQPETFAGGSIEGWLYYVVPNLAVLGKFQAFDPSVNYTDVPGGVGFFAVN